MIECVIDSPANGSRQDSEPANETLPSSRDSSCSHDAIVPKVPVFEKFRLQMTVHTKVVHQTQEFIQRVHQGTHHAKDRDATLWLRSYRQHEKLGGWSATCRNRASGRSAGGVPHPLETRVSANRFS